MAVLVSLGEEEGREGRRVKERGEIWGERDVLALSVQLAWDPTYVTMQLLCDVL